MKGKICPACMENKGKFRGIGISGAKRQELERPLQLGGVWVCEMQEELQGLPAGAVRVRGPPVPAGGPGEEPRQPRRCAGSIWASPASP